MGNLNDVGLVTAGGLQIAGLNGNQPGNFFIDGDYNKAWPTGLPVPEFPFLNEGDAVTLAFRQPHEQFAATYTAPDTTKQLDNVQGAYLTGDRNFQDKGDGVLAFERCAARIPGRRTFRGDSYRYPFQTINFKYDDGAITWTLGSVLRNVDSTLIYDYFLDGNQDEFPLDEAPLIFLNDGALQAQGRSYFGDYFPLYLINGEVCSYDAFILAEDDTYGHYAGSIMFRKRRVVAGPTPAFWGDTLPGTS